jgi:hypothetical protein
MLNLILPEVWQLKQVAATRAAGQHIAPARFAQAAVRTEQHDGTVCVCFSRMLPVPRCQLLHDALAQFQRSKYGLKPPALQAVVDLHGPTIGVW